MKKIIAIGLLSCVLTTSSMAEVNWELGMGSNYGGIIGVTANNKATDEVELYGGIGLVGAVAGARYYATNNIRLNLNYGVQGYLTKEGGHKDGTEILHGVNTGVDYIWDNGFSLGLVYHIISNADKKINEAENEGYYVKEKYGGKVKLSLGYRF